MLNIFKLNFTRRQWCTLLIMGIADFFNAVCVSLQAPFFPAEAEKKGAVATEYGFVFGVFELVVFLVSPIYGQYLNRIGPKLLFNAGIFTTGTSAIIFGLLDHAPDHTSFIALAFIIRIIEALGNAAFLTASFAIIAKEFPDNVATTFASLETCFGVGLIVGPMVGGILYSVGGYYLPFTVLGTALFTVAIFTLFILPKHTPDEETGGKQLSLSTVLRIPDVLVTCFAVIATSASIGFISATLEPHLRPFQLTPVIVGVIFVINGGLYAISAPFYGWVVDTFKSPKYITIVGTFMVIIGFVLVGPAAFIPVETTLPMVIGGLVCHGLGLGAVLISTFTDALKSSVEYGLPDDIKTYGFVSGLWTSVFAFGAFVGPSVSGFLFDSVGFRKATYFIIVLETVVITIIICFVLLKRKGYVAKKRKEILEEPLIQDPDNGNDPIYTKPMENGLTGNGIRIDHCRPCGMANNLLTCNSYNNKQQHWARLEGGSSLNVNFRPSYGSLEHPTPAHRAHRDYETIS